MKHFLLLSIALTSTQLVQAQTDIVITQPTSTSTNSVMIGVGTTSGNPHSDAAMFNTSVGYRAGKADVSRNSVYIGAFSGGGGARPAHHSVGVGAFAGYDQYLGSHNVMVGDSAGFGIGSAVRNVIIGASAGYRGGLGGSNTFVGAEAGRNANGAVNTFIGSRAGRSNQDGNANAFFGASAGENFQNGDYNTFLGASAGYSNQTGTENTFVGTSAGRFTTSSSNTMIGTYAGFNNTTGRFNTFVGVQAGQSNTTGSSNFFIGTNAGSANTTGTANFFLGDNAGGGNTTGGFNMYLGTNAGNGPGVNGDNNVSIGFESGRANTGVNNTFLGFRADAGANGLSNATAIGNSARVTVSNAVILGNNANVGIGVTAPSAKLEINSGVSNSAGIKLTSLTSNYNPSTNTNKFLTVDGSGNVILANYGSGGREGVSDILWKKTDTGILQTVQKGAVVIGNDLKNIPTGYQLYVADGILTEKVKVAIRNSSEWSDYVFAANYKLRTLKDVEKFVKVNKHLPGVPSADEVVEQGIDVAKMDAKLLAKIEELTLYTIQLEKQIEKANQQLEEKDKQQQAEIDTLKRIVNQLERRLK